MRFALLFITIISQQDYRLPCLLWLLGLQIGALLFFGVLWFLKKKSFGVPQIAFEASVTLLIASLLLKEVPSNRIDNNFMNVLLNLLLVLFMYCCLISKIVEFSLQLLASFQKKKEFERGGQARQHNAEKFSIRALGEGGEKKPLTEI